MLPLIAVRRFGFAYLNQGFVQARPRLWRYGRDYRAPQDPAFASISSMARPV
jgi:hypothetical protein